MHRTMIDRSIIRNKSCVRTLVMLIPIDRATNNGQGGFFLCILINYRFNKGEKVE